MNEKEELRKACLERRNALSDHEIAEKSAAVLRGLTSMAEIRRAETVLTYLSLGTEIDTHAFVDMLLHEGRTPIVPIVAEGRSLDWSTLKSRNDLERGPFGVPVPIPSKRRLVTPPPGAPVIVPGIAFTLSGHRLGYGAGYFDRFLAGHDGLKVGLACEAQIIPHFPLEPHDIPVDRIVTESRIHFATPE